MTPAEKYVSELDAGTGASLKLTILNEMVRDNLSPGGPQPCTALNLTVKAGLSP